MKRCDDPRWREACLRVDRAASLLERTRRSVDPRVWEARDRWAEAARAWLEGTGNINEAIEASLRFEESATTATTDTARVSAELARGCAAGFVANTRLTGRHVLCPDRCPATGARISTTSG